jgi:hypothetical protein
MTYRASSCVVFDGKLSGFIDMPSEPFAWVRFQFNKFDQPVPEDRMDRIAVSPSMVFEQDTASSLIAVSDELVSLFDRYGIAFTAELSELLTYEPALRLPGATLELRNFRLLAEKEVFRVWSHFLCLVDTWLDAYATKSSEVAADVEERQLMQTLLTQFVEAVPYTAFQSLGWSVERKNMIRYMLAPADIRVEYPYWQQGEIEAFMAKHSYRHMW